MSISSMLSSFFMVSSFLSPRGNVVQFAMIPMPSDGGNRADGALCFERFMQSLSFPRVLALYLSAKADDDQFVQREDHGAIHAEDHGPSPANTYYHYNCIVLILCYNHTARWQMIFLRFCLRRCIPPAMRYSSAFSHLKMPVGAHSFQQHVSRYSNDSVYDSI